jgi:putative ABC transport system permease protein
MDIGMHNENLIFFELNDDDMKKRYPAFKKEILRIPGVESMTASSFVPWQYGIIWDLSWYNEDVATQTKVIAADTSFLETYRLSITDGEPFKTDRLSMDGYILINESARRGLHSKGTDPLSRNICLGYGWCNRVCGIIKDFYFLYPTKRIRPLAILSSRYLFYLQNQMTVRLTEGNYDNVIQMIEEKVKRFFPNAPFEYKYVAREMEKMHAEKMGYRWMALLFTTGFALLIAAIGLFGFATYETQRCTKEIGIRKALGAKPMQIVLHFMLRFTKLTLIANVIAWPISYFLIHRILRIIDYPNPVQIRLTYFLWAGLLTLAMTILTVGVQTYRAARIDPVRALRYE